MKAPVRSPMTSMTASSNRCAQAAKCLKTSTSSEPETPRRVEGDSRGEDVRTERRDEGTCNMKRESPLDGSFGIFNTLLRGKETFNASRLGFL